MSEALPTERQVEQYLRENPDFFSRNPNLLLKMDIPHRAGDAASLLEYQVAALRNRNRDLNSKLRDLIAVAADNEKRLGRVHELTLAILEMSAPDQLADTIHAHLRSSFGADYSALLMLMDNRLGDAAHVKQFTAEDAALQPFQDFMKRSVPACGRVDQQRLTLLFDEDAGAIRSAVLLPLGERCELGILAIGSEDSDRFHPGMGTTFLNLLGDVLTAALRSVATDDQPIRESQSA